MERRALYAVLLDGADITTKVDPLLQQLSVTDKAGHSSDKASLTLNDQGGQIVLPRDGAQLIIRLGWEGEGLVEVFRGKVSSVKSAYARGQGLELRIEAEGFDPKGKAKEPQERHWDDASLRDILTQAGEEAGVTDIRVDASLAAQTFDYMAMQGESFAAFGQRLADMVGGTFRISDGRAALVLRNGGLSASGQPLTPITAAAGRNLINAQLSPFEGRPRFREARIQYWDPASATLKQERVSVEDEGASAAITGRYLAPTKDEAKRRAGSAKTEAERQKGGGTVLIDGDPRAKPEAPCAVSGVREGIDGDYRIEGVTHDFSRSSGFTTSLELKKPAGAVGQDKRGKKATAPAATAGTTSRNNSALNTTGGGGSAVG